MKGVESTNLSSLDESAVHELATCSVFVCLVFEKGNLFQTHYMESILLTCEA